MSTRGLYGFVVDGKVKVTYNHSDSYPEGLGQEIVEWLRGKNFLALKDKARDLLMVNEDTPPTAEELERFSSTMNTRVGGPDKETWYNLLREAQGNPGLNLEQGVMIDSQDFALDSLFCEWGYLINFDTNTFEIYQGYNNKGRPKRGLWKGNKHSHKTSAHDVDSYYAIELVRQFPFSELPKELEPALNMCKVDEGSGQCGCFCQEAPCKQCKHPGYTPPALKKAPTPIPTRRKIDLDRE